jgi:hypothetical protein
MKVWAYFRTSPRLLGAANGHDGFIDAATLMLKLQLKAGSV